MDFDGKVAVVSAAGGGIGAATALLLARAGATVVGVDIDADALAEREQELGDGGRWHSVVADVTSRPATEALVAEVMAAHGRVDSLVNVAGGSRPGQTVVALEPSEWDRLVALNLTSVYLMCRAAIPHMEAAGGGTIVNVSSGAGLRGMQANPAYVAAKAGVVALTRSLAIDHGPNGVRSNAVAPGPVATPLMRRNRTPDEIAYIARQTLVGRVGEPDELAHAIAWLASGDSSYVMGQTIAVDGGVVAGI